MKKVQSSLFLAPQRLILTVSELTEAIRQSLSEFHDIWITGEISGVKVASSGHIYFALKDEESQIRCVCFVRTARFLRFKPRDGLEVIVRGRIDIYAQRGEYQFLVDAIEPRGYGALQLAFEELKRKLAAEGLFDTARKRPIPSYPRRIGIVTSPAGAVFQDMVNVLTRRFPGIHIRLYPTLVQGEGAAAQIVQGIEYFSSSQWADVVIVARGGGSPEDLWAFNEEAVARAIAACTVPVVSAVGHETDFTIADFVADLRAPTPSAAAELVSASREHTVERLEGLSRRLVQTFRARLLQWRRRLETSGSERALALLHRRIGKTQQRVDDLEYRLREAIRTRIEAHHRLLAQLETRLMKQDLRVRLAAGRLRWEAATSRLERSIRMCLARAKNRFEPLAAGLHQLSPLRVLDRGYAIVQTSDGSVVKDALELSVGQPLKILLARGAVGAEVNGIYPPRG
ncbi:MAG: exodeoxyribonuclease VII large subunit [Bryobacteraceae bacterium]|nr:exodeoxyribonuclease VII large subunit [Bryobacteraceae bacterium]MDW8376701.1 exodeoxyribonuclease VII large subunit [Bryobacterales bacterium]